MKLINKYMQELKQETIEEVATKEGLYRASQNNLNQASARYNAKWFKRGAVFGAKWQEQRMYSEEEVLNILESFNEVFPHDEQLGNEMIKHLFEQFKKK